MVNSYQDETDDERMARHTLAISYANTFIVPLAARIKGDLYCLGTGTLFEIDNNCFVVTAAHVCKEGLNGLFIPVSGDLDDVITLENISASYTQNTETVDVGVIEIEPVSAILLKSRNYNFASLDMVDLRGEANPALITGYPEQNYPTTGTGSIRSLALLSGKIDKPENVDPPAIEGLDIFYKYARTAFRFQRESWDLCSTPELTGVSGASVWCMLRPLGQWRPKDHLKITGIEIAYEHGRYTRVQTWWAVLKLLCIKMPEIHQVVAIKTGIRVEEIARMAVKRVPDVA